MLIRSVTKVCFFFFYLCLCVQNTTALFPGASLSLFFLLPHFFSLSLKKSKKRKFYEGSKGFERCLFNRTFMNWFMNEGRDIHVNLPHFTLQRYVESENVYWQVYFRFDLLISFLKLSLVTGLWRQLRWREGWRDIDDSSHCKLFLSVMCFC